MRRRLFTILSALSLLICAGACVLWVRAAHNKIPDQWIGLFGSRYDVIADPGSLALLRATPEDDGQEVLLVRYWILLSLTGILPLLWLGVAMFQAKSNCGRCQACGYDLRATPARCPECGTLPTQRTL
jgi:4-amino-4-deoxy-L-arabinose transferase-like glycosyltransferase